MALRTLLTYALIFGWLAVFYACGNDDGGPLPEGPGACTIAEATFDAIYDGRLSTPQCANAGCHGAANQGDLRFDMGADMAFTALMAASANASATQPNRISAGDPASSWFYLKISDSTVPGGIMPLGGMLDACEIQAVEAWINAGAMR